MTARIPLLEIDHAEGSRVYTTDGRCLIDLMNGFGAVFLGHRHPAISVRVTQQIGRVWTCGRMPVAPLNEANALVARILPPGLRPAGLYSTGMEAAEFALRLAACHTRRDEFIGFARSMHGKSAMTAALCWANAPIGAPRVHVLPFVCDVPEDAILERLEPLLRTRRVAAVFIEPIQGSNGGYEASLPFYDRVLALCRESATVCVFDEILTGLYRTGSAFYVNRLALEPDMLLFAKCMGNGFPISSIAVRDDIDIVPAALPGSTFSGNALASAAAAATLTVMHELPMAQRVAIIEDCVRACFGERERIGILRGRGALWLLELAPCVRLDEALRRIEDRGVLVSSHGRCLRLLPAATIDPSTLREACEVIASACDEASR
jgi:acetylornithine/succinyldiaminopimelate/putrescine aminotransferase